MKNQCSGIQCVDFNSRPMGYKLSCCGSLLVVFCSWMLLLFYFLIWCTITPICKGAFSIYSSKLLLLRTDAEKNPDRWLLVKKPPLKALIFMVLNTIWNYTFINFNKNSHLYFYRFLSFLTCPLCTSTKFYYCFISSVKSF